jgi:hypothetical protein
MLLKVVSDLELEFRRNEDERHITLGLRMDELISELGASESTP